MADNGFFEKAGKLAGGIFGGLFGAGVGLVEGSIKAIETGKLAALEEALEKRTDEFLEGGKKVGEVLAPKAADAIESLFTPDTPPQKAEEKKEEEPKMPLE